MKPVFQMISSFFITLVTYLFGGMDSALTMLLITIGLDLVSGLSKSYIQGNLSYKAGMKGCIKKLGFLSLVAVAVIVDKLCDSGGVIRTFVIYYFVINECISILENYAAMKLPIPKILMDKLEQLKENQIEK